MIFDIYVFLTIIFYLLTHAGTSAHFFKKGSTAFPFRFYPLIFKKSLLWSTFRKPETECNININHLILAAIAMVDFLVMVSHQFKWRK